jgi:hypothetical protein
MHIPISFQNLRKTKHVLVVYPAIAMLTNPTMVLLLEKLDRLEYRVDEILPLDKNAVLTLRGKRNIYPVFLP